MIESLPSIPVELSSQEVFLGSNFISFLEGEFNFETWLHESEILRDFEVELEHQTVGIKLEPENWGSNRVPHIEALHLSMLI